MRRSAFISLILASLSLPFPASSQEVQLRVDATPSIFAGMFRELVSTFESKNPNVHITLDVSQRDQTDAIQLTLRKGIVGDLPDVSFQGFNYLQLLSDQNYAAPLDDFIEKDAEWKTDAFSKSVTKPATVGGKILGLGVALSFPIVYYNTDLVKEARGGAVGLPDDWAGILEIARKVQEAHPDILGAYTRYNAFLMQGHIMSSGGRLGNPEGTQVTFTDAAGLKAFERIKQFGELGQAKVDMTDAQARQSFAGGKIAVLVDSSSSLENYQQQSAGRFVVGTAPLPFATNAALPISGIASVMHTRDAKRQEAAWRFMRFVSSADGQAIVGRNTGYVPANEVAVQKPELLGNYYKDRPATQAALSSIPYATGWYVFKGPNNARIDKLFLDHMQQVVTLRQDPLEAANALAKDIAPLIKE